MGSIAATVGSVRVKTCSEVGTILKDLGRLAEGMDERRVESRKANRRKYGPGVMEIEIYISGHTSASHASEIDEKIRELGPYAVKAGRFDTEWECEKDRFFVGTEEQVAVAESADALERMQALAPKLQMAKVEGALEVFFDLEEADPGAAVTDVLVDLRHFCDRHSLDLGSLYKLAHSHYLAELEEERQKGHWPKAKRKASGRKGRRR